MRSRNQSASEGEPIKPGRWLLPPAPGLSKFMNGFKKKGFVRYNGGLQINSALITGFLQGRPTSVARNL